MRGKAFSSFLATKTECCVSVAVGATSKERMCPARPATVWYIVTWSAMFHEAQGNTSKHLRSTYIIATDSFGTPRQYHGSIPAVVSSTPRVSPFGTATCHMQHAREASPTQRHEYQSSTNPPFRLPSQSIVTPQGGPVSLTCCCGAQVLILKEFP